MLSAAGFRQYWNEARRPLVCLVFALPFLALYELGMALAPGAQRNGAEVWMRGWLGALGLENPLVLPVVVVGVLLAWHHMSRQPWRFAPRVLLLMAVESAVVGLGLRLLASAFMWRLSLVRNARYVLRKLVEYAGAGIYEETLFRLVLLSLLLAVFSQATSRGRAVMGAALVSSLLFALAHHLGAHGEPFVLDRFLFRAAAGVLFAVIFLHRGFGIAIGAHAMYDVLVGMGR